MPRKKQDGTDDQDDGIETQLEEVAVAEVQAERLATQEIEPDLIAMGKGAEIIHVHPSTVKAHQDAGWEAV